jgi:hypothetical protein
MNKKRMRLRLRLRKQGEMQKAESEGLLGSLSFLTLASALNLAPYTWFIKIGGDYGKTRRDVSMPDGQLRVYLRSGPRGPQG